MKAPPNAQRMHSANATQARAPFVASARDGMAEASPISHAYLGNVYTPAVLARWVADLVAQELGTSRLAWSAADLEFERDRPTGTTSSSAMCWRPVVVDVACGDGALLTAMRDASAGAAQLVGVDVDATAVRAARRSMGDGARFLCADALLPVVGLDVPAGWNRIMERQPVDAVIANPPWGADLPHSAAALRRAGYTLANGQFDSFDLFLELALQLVRSGGIVAFIVPDALFLPEHAPLRRRLASQTELQLIARLGEGFFPGVYRGTAVIVCRNHAPRPAHEVRCVRLTKAERDAVFAGQSLLADACRRVEHRVPQARFSQDVAARFDIDVDTTDSAAVTLIDRAAGDWTRRLISGRGVELSKHGVVVFCPWCSAARPKPRGVLGRIDCSGCGATYDASNARVEQIIRRSNDTPRRRAASIVASVSRDSKGTVGGADLRDLRTSAPPVARWQPIIVGEDVDRYAATTDRRIRLGVSGINYKTPESFSPPKLVIRKTGVGLKVALDTTGAFTNQVVFHYYAASATTTPAFYLDYVLGVLCSRVLLAHHLKRTGETEWRSHPYVTQHVIAALPVPNIHQGTWQWDQARAIADAATRARELRQGSSAADALTADLYVERLVAGLYELREADCAWVPRVLDAAEGLEPIRSVRFPVGARLEPLRANASAC